MTSQTLIVRTPQQAAAPAIPLVSIIAPTMNERDNIPALVASLDKAFGATAWELIIVDDDSRDGTAETVKRMAREDPRLRCIRRIGRRGLASAGTEGFLASSAPYVALMDADLQHDATVLPQMLSTLVVDEVDIVIGSRYIAGGSAAGLADDRRAFLSKAGGWLARRVLHVPVSDPMSGFFMMRREVFDQLAPALSQRGFKLLADILLSAPKTLRVRELPIKFNPRLAGESKLDAAVSLDYLFLIADKTVGRILPVRFILFSMVGGFGLLVHLFALALYGFAIGVAFWIAQLLASFTAMTVNYFINNAVTYRDKRLKGFGLLWGLVTFYAVCSIGLAANVGVANILFLEGRDYLLAGAFGALVGGVWNCAASYVLTWKAHR
jgi:dolichol-phosphate mannosyltransferase